MTLRLALLVMIAAAGCKKPVQLGKLATADTVGDTPGDDGTSPNERSASAGSDATPGALLTVKITSPNGRASYLPDELATFAAVASDGGNRPVVPDALSWRSSLVATPLGTTSPIDVALGTIGQHRVTVTSQALGRSVDASVDVDVVDPSTRIAVRLDAPLSDAVLVLDDAGGIAFSLTIAATPIVAASSLTYTFRTSTGVELVSVTQSSPSPEHLVGTLRAGTVSEPARPASGAYDVIVTVCEPSESGCRRTGTARVSVLVLPQNAPPLVHIDSPAAEVTTLSIGSTLALSGTVTDPDASREVLPDRDLEGVWTDSVIGKLGTGPNATLPATGTNEPGKHLIRFCATDHAGAVSCAERSVFVQNAPIIEAVATSLGGRPANAIVEAANGDAWIATDQGLFAITAAGTVVSVMTINDGSHEAQAFFDLRIVGPALYLATDEGLWRCLSGANGALSGCARLGAASGGSLPNGYVPDAELRLLALDGATLLAAGESGIAVVENATQSAAVDRYYEKDNGFIAEGSVQGLQVVGSTLWLIVEGDGAGLCVSSGMPTGASFTCGPAPSVLSAFLQGGARELLATTEDGHPIVYIGTTAGLVRYDTVSGAAIRYTKETGLAGDRVTALVARAGAIWVGTRDGLTRLEPGTGLVTSFYASDFGAGSSAVNALGVVGSELWINMGTTTPALFRYSGR